MKKVYKIIIGILILALAAGTVTFVVMKKNKRTSVDSKAEQLIARWFDAMTEKDVDGCIGCCFTEALLDSYVKSKGITKEDYTEYIKYQLEVCEMPNFRKTAVLNIENLPSMRKGRWTRIHITGLMNSFPTGKKLPQCMKLLFPMRFLMRMNGKKYQKLWKLW